MRKFRSIVAAGVSLLALSSPAMAQEADSEDQGAGNEIVVTGTQSRGVAATGTQSISVDSAAILDKAAISTNELLSLVPQISNTFNGRFEGDPRGVGAGISITKPNLRGLPGANSSSGGTTLVIANGFRFTPVGVNQSSVDVDVIPAAVLEGMANFTTVDDQLDPDTVAAKVLLQDHAAMAQRMLHLCPQLRGAVRVADGHLNPLTGILADGA